MLVIDHQVDADNLIAVGWWVYRHLEMQGTGIPVTDKRVSPLFLLCHVMVESWHLRGVGVRL